MKIHIITKDQLNENNEYIGSVDLSDFDGAIESVEGLGNVKFNSLGSRLYIKFRVGSGIESNWEIRARLGIDSGFGIKARHRIIAGDDIYAVDGIEARDSIEATGRIIAERGIKAGSEITVGRDIHARLGIRAGNGIKVGGKIYTGRSIKAGNSIAAGTTIYAESGIEAGSGIIAGLSIKSKFISCNTRIFAGTCSWKIPEEHEMQISGEIRKGVVAYGIHVKEEKNNE